MPSGAKKENIEFSALGIGNTFAWCYDSWDGAGSWLGWTGTCGNGEGGIPKSSNARVTHDLTKHD